MSASRASKSPLRVASGPAPTSRVATAYPTRLAPRGPAALSRSESAGADALTGEARGGASRPGEMVAVLPPGQVPPGARVLGVVVLIDAGPATDSGGAAQTVPPPALAGPAAVTSWPALSVPPVPSVPAPGMPAPGGLPAAAFPLGGDQPLTAAASRVPAWSPAGADLHELRPGLRLNRAERRVFDEGIPLDLTRREFDLLAHLAATPNRVVTRSQLLAAVWHYPDPQFLGTRTVDVHVLRVRRKLGARHRASLQTVRGVGYRWSA